MTDAARRSLLDLANSYKSDKGSIVGDKHRYTYLYDLLFEPMRDSGVHLLELGLARGGPETNSGRVERRVDSPSVAMWLEYFPKAQISGFDISDFSHIEHERFKFFRGDAGNSDDVARLAREVGSPDIIIDDASHASYHQQHCLRHLFDSLKPGGIYIIEDLHWQSPVFEKVLPKVPKTAEWMVDVLENKSNHATVLFTEAEVQRFRDSLSSWAIFPDFGRGSSTIKLIVLRKKLDPIEPLGLRRADSEADPSSGQPSLSSTANAAPAAGSVAQLRAVRSFDLFDTLVARRCIDPREVFSDMERKLGLGGFAARRIAAERAVAKTDYTLDHIYQNLGESWPEVAGRMNEIKNLELQLEWDNLFPIASNISKVKSGDIIVSDMYLPQYFVEDIIRDIAGLEDVKLYLSARGKEKGKIWAKLLKSYSIIEHLGDNVRSDVNSPRAAGISSNLSRIHEPNETESILIGLGLRRLAERARVVRLSQHCSDPVRLSMQAAQISSNAPMLLLASVSLLEIAKSEGFDAVLASSRDGYLWHQMLQRVRNFVNFQGRIEYFLTSRIPRSFPSPTYSEYVRSLVGNGRSLIVDVCGTGWSLERLVEKVDLRSVDLLLLHKMNRPGLRAKYEDIGSTSGKVNIRSLLTLEQDMTNKFAELANSAPHPTVLDVVLDATTAVPVYGEWNENARIVQWRRVQERAFRVAMNGIVDHSTIRELVEVDDDVRREAIAAMYRSLGLYRTGMDALSDEHQAEDRLIRRQLEGFRAGEDGVAAS